MSFSVFTATQEWLNEHKIKFSAFETTTSTNDLAKKEIFGMPMDAVRVYLADQQTLGRGRGQNTWLNPEPGTALLVSWSFTLAESPQSLTGPLFGLAVYRSLKAAFSRTEFSIKAPNDIYVADKKILGILVETVKQGGAYGLVVGLGLNVFSNPANISNSENLARHAKIDTQNWPVFLKHLQRNLEAAALAAQGSHLTDQDRTELLVALNKYVGLKAPYQSVSPFGDLVTESQTISWRQL